MDDIFKKDLNGEMVSPQDEGYDALIGEIYNTMDLTQELATVKVSDQARVHELMARILGK